MWNIFKSRQAAQHGEKEEDTELVLRQLRARFQQRMKVLAQSISQAQDFFEVYAQISPKEQALATTFQEMMASLEGLVSIIEDLRKEMTEAQEQLDQLKKAKDMVANHHNIVTNIQQSYSEQIRGIYAQHQQQIQALKNQKMSLIERINIFEEKQQQVTQRLQENQQKIQELERENYNIKQESLHLKAELQEVSMKYQKFLDGEVDTKKIINLQAIKLEHLFYYKRLKVGVAQFLTIQDFQKLKTLNKFFKHSLQKEQSKLLYNNLKKYYQKRQLKETANLKYYEKVMQLFPSENIKVNAIKYLHFRIKPATYILPYLQEEIEIPEKVENEAKERSKFNWRGLFTNDKQKKDQNKFSLSQLRNEEEFKKIEAKLERTFKDILNMKLPQDLVFFSEMMERQLHELKDNLGSKGQKGSQIAWTAELQCLCRFMYLQINELYNLVQVIFGQIVVKSRKLIFLQEAHDQLRENETVLRNLIENLSRDKANFEKKALFIENEILKRNLEKDTLVNSFEQASTESTQLRVKCENLINENANFRKVIQKMQDERRQLDERLSKIRKELECLDDAPQKPRKMSEISVSSQGTYKD